MKFVSVDCDGEGERVCQSFNLTRDTGGTHFPVFKLFDDPSPPRTVFDGGHPQSSDFLSLATAGKDEL
jgi:hypothetical protein